MICSVYIIGLKKSDIYGALLRLNQPDIRRKVMFNKSIKSKRRYSRRLAAIFMAGMIMLTGCGKTGSANNAGNETPSESPTLVNPTTEIQPTENQSTENPATEDQSSGNETTGLQSSKEPAAQKEISTKTVLLGANMEQGKVDLPSPDEEKKFIDGTADFSFELMKLVLENEKGNNVMVSPISIINALGMTENGATSQTLTEMEKVLGKGMARDEYNRALSAYCKSLKDEEAEFSNANSIWIKEGIVVKDGFIQNCKDYYDSEIYQAPFDSSTIDDINNWGYNNTNGLVEKTIDDIDKEAIMYLINALYFEAEWKKEYSKDDINENAVFTDKDGNEDKVAMLSSKESCYFTLDDGIGFRKPYKGDKYSFVGILPAEGKSPEEYMSEIKGNDFIATVTNPDYSKEVYVKIPEFSADYRTSLRNVLMDMGMETAFSNADFSEMFDLSSVDGNGADISDVFHNTHIDVDRKGTRAAATTAVEMKSYEAVEEKAVVYITLDKPFVYMIIDNETGLPVFMGTCNDIK